MDPQATASLVDQPAEGIAPTITHDADPVSADAGPVNTSADEATRLQHLSATFKNQDDLEQDVGRQADQMLMEQADERDSRRLDRTQREKRNVANKIENLQLQLRRNLAQSAARKHKADLERLQAQLEDLNRDFEQIQERMQERENSRQDLENAAGDELSAGQRRPGETRRDFLIRTGKITPFSRFGHSILKQSADLVEVLQDAEDNGIEDDHDRVLEEAADSVAPVSHRNLKAPGFADSVSESVKSRKRGADKRPQKIRRSPQSKDISEAKDQSGDASDQSDFGDEYVPKAAGKRRAATTESESDGIGLMAQGVEGDAKASRSKKRQVKTQSTIDDSASDDEVDDGVEDLAALDDGKEALYQSRLRKWNSRRSKARQLAQSKRTTPEAIGSSENVQRESPAREEIQPVEEECYRPHPTIADTMFEDGFKIPGDVYPSLFDYQKTGVQWLWELWSQQVGGIIGDEMGLGKTIQIISFLAGLHYSKKYTKPIIVVAPATVMKQWVQEFHRWWPPLRVSILHSSGSGMMNLKQESQIEDDITYKAYSQRKIRSPAYKAAAKVVDRVFNEGHVLVTTYSGLQTFADLLLPKHWGYAILDEGHKIRNPNSGITIYCKSLQTSNRIILSGTPMQNNMTELWSLFDFVFPMRLGNLVNFRQVFENPIKFGGYANASNLQVQTGANCAETLKEAISPYLLQRYKSDVASDLPIKSEQVLFCQLTQQQRDLYTRFLASDDLKSIMYGKRNALYGIDILRKICNHPDLVNHQVLSAKAGYDYGDPAKSGKINVVKALLEVWRDTGHKTLLFAQHRIMLDIVEKFIKTFKGINYRRMDGNTVIKNRQSMVDEFNKDPNIHVFLLTTRVGGLGVNLTGADRVIIYDPDWNPSTDMQARERAWRLGQKREVAIFRLLTAGTIEEKIYHRQLFKSFLTNKILKDPKQQQTFQMSSLQDLFTLGSAHREETETGKLFEGTETHIPKSEQTQQLNDKAARSWGHAVSDSWRPNGRRDDERKISSIKGIARREAIKPDAAEQSQSSSTASTSTQAGPSTSTDNITPSPDKKTPKPTNHLTDIFSSSGVTSTLAHDAIMTAHATKSNPMGLKADPEIIAREARRVADEAAKQLQRDYEASQTVTAGTVTWTGLHGDGGRPSDESTSSVSRGGGLGGRSARGGGAMASSALLSNLSNQQQSANASGNGPRQPQGKDFLTMIHSFLKAHNGKVPSVMLVQQFNRYCGTPQRVTEFQEMLKRIAVLEGKSGERERQRGRFGGRIRATRVGRGWSGQQQHQQEEEGPENKERGYWVLKKEFGGTAESG